MWELAIPLMKFIGALASVLTLKSILIELCSPDWILSKCSSPRFTESHDKLNILCLTSECILRWGGCVKENFLCTTNFNKFVDCGSHTEPKEAFVMWPESLLTVNRCRTGQAVIKRRRCESKGETVCLLVLAVLPYPCPGYLLQTLNCLPCA